MTQNARFEKYASCPANEQLLAYRRGELNAAEADHVAAYVQACEFCFLLLDLIEFHPEGDPLPIDPAPMPESLRHLLSRRRQAS